MINEKGKWKIVNLSIFIKWLEININLFGELNKYFYIIIAK